MRLIVMGQQAFGVDVTKKLLESGEDEVVAVYCEPDREGRPVDPIKEFAVENNIPVEQPSDFSDTSVIQKLSSYDSDLMIMAFVNIFVPLSAREVPKLGCICFHPSLLPLHRGPSAVNWPIIMGETKSGYSWFYPTDGLDEGDSLLQWECDISPDDTVIDLYFKKIYPSAVDSVLDVCRLFRSGSPPRIVADESLSSYERRCTRVHSKIDWHKPVRQVYDLIRGTNPSPGSWTLYNSVEIDIFDCVRVSGDGVSGKIVEITSEGFVVQCIGGRILVRRVRVSNRKEKLSASDWIRESGISVGDKIGD